MTRENHRTRPAGFTLIEIMLAMGILGVVIGIVYGVFTRALAAKEHTEARAAETATARAVLNRVTRDLQSIVPRSNAPVPQGTPTPGIGLPKAIEQILFVSRNGGDSSAPLDDLAFSSLVRRPTSVSLATADLAVIRYFVESDPAAPARRALFRETTYSLSGRIFDLEEPDPASTMRLLDGIAAFELRFFDGEEWIQEWDSADPREFGPAPQAVEIAIGLYDAAGEIAIFRTAVDLPVVRAGPVNLPGQPGQSGSGGTGASGTEAGGTGAANAPGLP